jgi:outer membrane immunogenic protein
LGLQTLGSNMIKNISVFHRGTQMDKIRTSLLATAAVVALSTSAYAADMGVPRKAPPPAPPPAPIWNWTGFYVGGNLGVGISREKWSEQPVHFGSALFTTFNIFHNDAFSSSFFGSGLKEAGSHNSVGILGGFTAGYNWQFPNSPWLVGIEGEWMFSDLEGDHGTSRGFNGSGGFLGLFPFTGTEGSRLSTKVDDIATVAGRFGITSGPEDRTLWYVKGGWAWARDKFGATAVANGTACFEIFCTGNSFEGSGSVTHNRSGWMVGTGVEWGLAYNLSAKIEYEFLDFGTQNFTIPISGTFADGDTGSFNRNFSVQQQIHVVKVGLNYRFNWGY